MKLIGRSIQMAYDSEGFKYDLPVFIINEPVSYEIQEVVEDKNQKVPNQQVSVSLIAANELSTA